METSSYWKHVDTLSLSGWSKMQTYEREVPSGVIIMTIVINTQGVDVKIAMQFVPSVRGVASPYR